MSSCEEVSGKLIVEMREILALGRRAGELRTVAGKLRGLGFIEQAEGLDALSRDAHKEAEGREERLDEMFRRLAGVCR